MATSIGAALFILLLSTSVAVLGGSLLPELTVAGAFGILLIAAMSVDQKPRLAAILVIGILFASRYRFEIGDLTVGVDQLSVLAVFLALAFIPRTTSSGGSRPIDFAIVAYLLLGLFGGMFAGIPPDVSLRNSVFLAVACSAYLLPRWLHERGVDAEQQTRWIVGTSAVIGAIAATVAVVAYLSDFRFGVQEDPSVAGIYLAHVSVLEANLLASILAAALILAVTTEPASWSRSRAHLAQFSIAAGLVATFTRSAWIGFAIGLAVSLAVAKRRAGGAQPGASRRLLVLLAVPGLALLLPAVRQAATERFLGLLDFSSGSGYGRVQIARLALASWRERPWTGQGFLSFDQLLPGQAQDQLPWIPSFGVAVLHDTGIIGLLVISAFFVLLVRQLLRSERTPLRCAWLGAVVALMVTSQATQSQVLPFFWYLLGVAELVSRPTTAPEPATARDEPQRDQPLAPASRLDVRSSVLFSE